MKCIVGLGNPGRKYANTRHNVGYMVLREIAGRFRLAFSEAGFSEVAVGTLPAPAPLDGSCGGTERQDRAVSSGGTGLLLVRPLTYMNVSGRAVTEIIRDYPVTCEDIIVIHDDMDLPLGKIRIRRRGSSGGHKGVLSIAHHLGTPEFPRLKVGIGRPPEGVDPVDFVLESFREDESSLLREVISLSADAAIQVFTRGIDWAMGEYNGRDSAEENGTL